MIKAGVIGHPVSHSKSPLIHRYWLEKYGIKGEYTAYDLAPEGLLETAKDLLVSRGLSGFNVTLPHKQSIVDLCTTLSDEAKAIGAVNTVVYHSSGEIEGRNTDAFGFMENARGTLPRFDWSSGAVTVLGAGGASRAVIYALQKAGVSEIRLANRSSENAKRLADDFGVRPYEWEERNRMLEGTIALINTTSLGMKGQEYLEIDLGRMSPNSLVYDIVYVPLETELLRQAHGRGLQTITGIGMLLHQARPAFAAWFGVMPEVTEELKQMVLTP